MKKIIVLIGLILGIFTAYGQFPKPALSDSIKPVYSPSMQYDLRDSSLIYGKGPYLYNKVWSTRTTQWKLDSLGHAVNVGIITMPSHIKNGDGTITLGDEGLFIFAKNPTGDEGLQQLRIPLMVTLTLTDGAVNFVYADYNNGNPVYTITLNNMVFKDDFTKVPVIRATREGNVVHFEEYDLYGLVLANKLMIKDVYLRGGERLSGLILSTTPTRISTVSSGTAVFAVQYYENMGVNISGSSGTMYQYYLTSGVWGRSAVTSYDASYYSDGTNRIALSNNKWVSKYFWRDVGDDNEVYYIHGNQYEKETEAINELIPTAPTIMTSHSVYVGKIVIQKDALNGTAFPRVWDGPIQNAGTNKHSDLSAESLVWVNSAHTGTPSTVATFDATGKASNSVLVSDETYSATWDGVTAVAPSKNSVYDKVSTLESINYCATTMTVNSGTLNQGTVSNLCAVGGTDVIVQEQVASPPFQITFTFTGVTRLSGFKFYGRYNGGATHNVHVEAYNYITAAWDYVGEFSTTATKQWFAYNLNLPNNYISTGTTQVRIIHQANGINTHQMILDYVNVNYGGGGGSGFITAGAVEATPGGSRTGTNVQSQLDQLDVNKEPANANIQQHITNDADLSLSNEFNTSVVFNKTNNTINITDAGGTKFDTLDINTSLLLNEFTGVIPVTSQTVSFNWPVQYPSANYNLYKFAYYIENINGKIVKIRNAIYDEVQTATGFSLKVDTIAGFVEYRASRIIHSETPASVLLQSDLVTIIGTPGADNKVPTEKATRDAIAGFSSMVYPPSGIPISTGTAWTASTPDNHLNWDKYNQWNGDANGLNSANGRASLGGTTIGQAIFTSPNPGAIVFGRGNADNTFSWLSASDFKTAIGGGVTNNSQIIKFDTGTTEGTDLYTFNGFAAKTIDIKAGTNITLTKAANSVTIAASSSATSMDLTTALSTNQSYLGITESATVGENVVFGDVLYLKFSDGKWWKAKADAYATTPAMRMALASISANNSGTLLIEGNIRYDSWSFAANKVYLSAATAGAITTTQPATTGNQIQALGIAKTSTKLYFKPSQDVGEK